MTGEIIIAKYLKQQEQGIYTIKGGEAFLAKEIDDAISTSWQDGYIEATNQSGLVREDLFNNIWDNNEELNEELDNN